MGRGDQDKRLRRAGEQVDKALARRELERAIDAVLGLERGAREPLLALVAPAFRRTVLELHKASAWGRLHTLAARSEQEPRLLLHGADEAAEASVRWPLLLACIRARDVARATRIWAPLAKPVTDRAPSLARAMAAWIEGQGQLGRDAIADLDLDGLPLPVLDPRPGVESPGRARPAPPSAPSSLEQVDVAAYALFATQPLTAVSDTLRRWLESSPVDVARALRMRAGSLSLRALLLQASAQESLALPAAVLAAIAEGAEDVLESELLLATRLSLTTAVCHPSRRGAAESLACVAGALVRTGQMGDGAASLVLSLSTVAALRPTALAVCQSALGRAASLPDDRLFRLWTFALALSAHLHDDDPDERGADPGPAWLQATSREVCKRGSALVTYLDKSIADVRGRLLDDLLWGQPSEIVAELIDVSWSGASESLRRDLSALLPDLIENAEEAGMHALEASHSLHDLAAFDRIAQLANAADPNLPFLAVGGLALWRRFGARALPYCVGLLPYALSQAKPGQRMEVVQSFIGGRDIDVWLEAVRELSAGEPEVTESLVAQTVRAMLDRFRDDRRALARGLGYAEKFHAPIDLLRGLGHAYERAALAQEIDGAEVTPEDRRARAILDLVFGGRLKKRAAKPPTKRKRKKKSNDENKTGKRSGPDGQLGLPFGENEP
jgi:hypothetical protein